MWSVPLYNQTAIGLDVGPAVPIEINGGGADVIGIPSHGHPFQSGQNVRFSGTTNYSVNLYTVQATTTENQIVIVGGYVAETFDGSELVQQYIQMPSSLGRSQQDSDGNIYVGHSYTTTHISKIETDGTIVTDFFNPTTAWPGGAWSVTALVITDDELYLYCAFDQSSIYKFDLSDGSEVWHVTGGNLDPYWGDVDSSGNLYLCQQADSADHDLNAKSASKFDADDGTKTDYEYLHGAFALAVSDTLAYDGTTGVIVTGGKGTYQPSAPSNYLGSNLFIHTIDDPTDNDKGTHIRLGPWESEGAFNFTQTIGSGNIQIYDGFIYVLLVGVMYKLNTDLEIIKQVEIDDAQGFYFDLFNNLVVIKDDGASNTDRFQFYTPDLVFSGESDGWYTGLVGNWRSGTAYIQGNNHFYVGFSAPSAFVAPGSHQYRTVAYPQDHAHLEGQTVQVLSDGIYLDDDTYTIVGGTESPAVSGTTDHIGLQVVSKLQPMKIDGEVHVKKIRQIIPDVYESVGGEYGKELDDMYTMELRTTNDIMERDNALYSGYVELPYKGQYDRSGDMWFTQDIPLPLTLLGIGVRLSKEDI
jgi:hypothetical protein